MENRKNNISNIFYGVIGVATLMVAVVGATFAYYTATASNNIITGNMATVKLDLAVTKVTTVDETKGGMIPMSNGMVNAAVTATNPCVDDNGNAVCQIYEITLTNDSSSGQFVDGYVTLTGGSGEAFDYTSYNNTSTTMRWAQVFKSGTTYSTGGAQTLLDDDGSSVSITAIGDANSAHATGQIKTAFGDVTGETEISGNNYDTITSNYIRISDHDGTYEYDREDDITSALVFNHSLTSDSEVKYYFVVWLSETGTDQTAESDEAASGFFRGTVTFISAQGSEISATFSGFARVEPDTTNE